MYEKLQVLHDLCIDVKDGEYMVIVGPSGSGKTTILRMIAGLENVTTGHIMLNNSDVNNVPPRDRHVAMMFQNYALYPHMNVFQNMTFGLKLNKVPVPEIIQRTDVIAQMLEIQSLLDRRPDTLSGGQRQRVALGRAILSKPQIFLLDEPLSNLDARFRTEIRSKLRTLFKKLSATVIHVTHDQTEAMIMADTICVLNAGLLQQIGSPRDIYDHPSNQFVANFFGTPPMNFIKGIICEEKQVYYFVFGNDRVKLPRIYDRIIDEHINRKMIFGIRPEHLEIRVGTNQLNMGIPSTVEAVDQLGTHTEILVRYQSGDYCVVRTMAQYDINIGDEVLIHIDAQKGHIFDPENNRINVIVQR